jgi:hypothetical protein
MLALLKQGRIKAHSEGIESAELLLLRYDWIVVTGSLKSYGEGLGSASREEGYSWFAVI